MPTLGKLLAVAAVVALVASACGDDSEDAAAHVTIVAEDHRFTQAPAEVEAGLLDVTFENTGQADHELALVEIGDTPIDQVGEDFAPALELAGAFPDYARNLAIPLLAEGGETVRTSMLIAEGNYALICTLTEAAPEGDAEGSPHYELGMIQPLTVTAGDEDATLPESESSVTARDHSFDVDVSAGRQTVNFINEGPDELHHAVFLPFHEGVDEAAAEAALDAYLTSASEGARSPPPPELDLEGSENVSNFGLFSAGLGASYEADFRSGRTYAVVCFIQDRAGGPPHVIANDMKQIFTVE